jgi:glycerol-3-phosphate acyltransferase PlsY
VGAFPTSYLVSRTFAGIDLRQHGSGNLGATNLYRVLGWKYAIPVALVDIAKGLIPVLVFAPQVSSSELFALTCGVAAILGHVFSVFVRFKGGKGVATASPPPWCCPLRYTSSSVPPARSCSGWLR